MNVLFVDDEPSFRLLVKHYLMDMGFTVFLADNGEEGMQRLKEEEIDIVISDLYMHVMDGMTFCKTARQVPSFKKIPFLFVSAYGDEQTVAAINSLGNCMFLSKVRPMSEMIEMIHHLAPAESHGGNSSHSDAPQVLPTPAVPDNDNSNGDFKRKREIPEHPHTLVVDDDDALRILLTDMLSKEGYVVKTAIDGQDAIEILQKEDFDLILLDIVMPNVSGFRVLSFIKEHNPSTKVIMLTAYSELKLAVECKEFGANDFIGKPFMRSDLLSTMRKVLSE